MQYFYLLISNLFHTYHNGNYYLLKTRELEFLQWEQKQALNNDVLSHDMFYHKLIGCRSILIY